MSLFNHINLGDLQSYVYLEGTIKAVYLETAGVAVAKWDTADVEYENKKIFCNAPVRYHCQKTGIDRANGAIVDGAKGFGVGDKVILMAKIGTTPGKGEEYEKMYVVAHRDGAVPCAYNYLFIRIGAADLSPLVPPFGVWRDGLYAVTNVNDHPNEYCTVWDAAKGSAATVYNPLSGVPYVFPVSIEDFKPALDYYRFADEELFTLGSQGDDQSQEAGFTPDWLSDFQGNKIREGVQPSAWWTSYDIYANPIFNLLANTSLALFTDSAGAGDGTFAKAMEKFNAGKENILKWKAASPLAFNDDTRSFDVKGSGTTEEMPPELQTRLQELQVKIGQMNDLIGTLDLTKIARWNELSGTIPLTDPALQAELVALSADQIIVKYRAYQSIRDTAQAEVDSILGTSSFTPWEIANDKDGNPLKGSSYHMQNAYGEDEIWVCGKNVYGGLVVNACDAAWKFVRLSAIPPYIPIAVPSPGGSLSLAEISLMVASSITTADDNNIFSYGTLKRVNDGGFHRTTHPALKTTGIGSFRMTQNPIPLSPLEPTFITAMNSRLEHIDVWHRYDNWMNSFQYSCATWGVDRTWWFKSNAEQWRIKATFIDTPIGSMWQAAPGWEAAIWYMSGLSFSPGNITARRDLPVNTHFTRQTKHSRRVISQIYIVQRQAVTMFENPALTTVRQEINKGIYDHLDLASIKYVGGVDYDAMTLEQKKAAVSDRVYLRSKYPGEVGYNPSSALRSNRNEVEIMAACDLYSTLKTTFGQCNPSKQIRNGLLEYEIQKLIDRHYTNSGLGLKDFSAFNLEARIA
ncbi:MAG TPA: hypothetical protein DDZ40_07255 [Deltaproteobacteria bacterium]|nr:hypothetical protein [Deltaproteobacteria bacterium]